MSDTPIELSDQDIEDLKVLADEAPISPEEREPQPRTLLEVWREVLSNIDTERLKHVDPQHASRIMRAWPYIKTQETEDYLDLYFEYLDELRNILLIEIEENPKALLNAEHDAEDNKGNYLNLLLLWQLQIQQWSKDWQGRDADSHLRMAAIAEAQNFFLGENGLVAHFEAIGFEYTEEDALMINELLVQHAED